MDDLISRQAAIRAVNTALFPKINTAKDAEKALRALPSAQPEVTDTNVGDMISRQEAKLAIIEKGQASKRYKVGEFWELNRDEIWDALDGVPSAQPERKTGKWNFIGDNMFECTSCGVVYTTNQLNGLRNCDVDPYAPKFCPSCGADMRGEQDAKLD